MKQALCIAAAAIAFPTAAAAGPITFDLRSSYVGSIDGGNSMSLSSSGWAHRVVVRVADNSPELQRGVE
jgi:hypothetical protein